MVLYVGRNSTSGNAVYRSTRRRVARTVAETPENKLKLSLATRHAIYCHLFDTNYHNACLSFSDRIDMTVRFIRWDLYESFISKHQSFAAFLKSHKNIYVQSICILFRFSTLNCPTDAFPLFRKFTK